MQIVSEGWRYAIPLAALAPVALFLAPPLTPVVLIAAAFVVWFFRDPERTPPPNGIVSPADGKVSVIREEGDCLRVGVYMNALDVHVNRAPIGGQVADVVHEPGAHRPAFSKDSDRNEQVHLRFPDHEVTLIAGAFARRITPYLDTGEVVERGDRIGHIAFGSRADVVLPPDVDRSDLLVEKGQTVRAGESILAREP